MTANPSAKPMPKVVSFQDTLPQPRRYRPRLTAFSPAIPHKWRSTCFGARTAGSIPAYGKPSPENGALSSPKANSAICSRALSWSPATMALSARSEQVTPSCRPPVLPALGKSSNPRKSSTHTMSDWLLGERPCLSKSSEAPDGL
jgi:hypothetical protein